MAYYVPISQERHAGKGWRKPDGYGFALGIETVPLVAAEMTRAAGSLPVVFVRQDGTFMPAALMGIGTGRNLFLTESGNWIGEYAPAALRTYPFRIGKTPQGQTVLCLDEASELLVETADAHPIFDPDGNPSEPLRQILELLKQVERSRILTEKAMAALAQAELICPWPIRVKTQDGEKPIEGLFQIDGASLRRLPSSALGPLHEAGALEIAYCQLISRQHVGLLSQLLEAHQTRMRLMAAGTVGILGPQESSDIEIDWSRFKQAQ